MLTTHTGSLPRPDVLVGEGAEARDEATLRTAVATVVGQQVEAGIDIVGDGEFSKPSYATYVPDRLTGFGDVSTPLMTAQMSRYPELMRALASTYAAVAKAMTTQACVERVRYRDSRPVERDIANLRTATEGLDAAEVFMTAASPGVIAWFYENRCYPSHEDYVNALADAMKAEYDAIHRAGFLLQIDCPDLAFGFDGWRDQPGLDLDKHRRRMAANIDALNEATRDIPADRMRMHVCWGNSNTPHTSDVPLRDIIDLLIAARPTGLSFVAANPRHAHEWILFEDVRVPDGKVLIPGVLDSTTNYVEHPELVAQRIRRYTDLVGWDRVIAGTDCGFSTAVGYTPVNPAVVWEKLRALAQGARIASKIAV
jgi:5-methyltetrahydropteroyltriglutamate--homocysteine methyltransferase